MKRILILALVLCIAALGCGKFKSVGDAYNKVVSMDISHQDQEMLNEKYVDTYAWTRTVLEDVTEREVPGEPKKQVILRDTKVTIVALEYSYSGAVTVQDPKKRKVIHGLDIETPLTVEKIEARLGDLMWFQDPMMRQVAYIRQWGKRAARAVVAHGVYIGMPAEAAEESWGLPTEIRRNEIGGKMEEQWAYRRAKRPKYIYIIDGVVSKWEE